MKVNGKGIGVLLAIVVVIGALYGGSFLVRRGDVSIPAPVLFPPSRGPRLLMSMEGFRFSRSESGRVAWRMEARNADLYENKEARLKNLRIIFTSPDSREAELIGDSGSMDTATGNASIRGAERQVRVITSDGYLLTTDTILWKADQRQVITPGKFKLLGRDIYFEGKDLSADVDLRTMVVNGNVKAVFQE